MREVLLAHLALQTLVLVMDGSVVGRGCVALMIHVVYKGRALPVAWLVRQGKKGTFLKTSISPGEQVQDLIPPGARWFAGRWRIRWDALQHTVQESLVLRGPDGEQHHGRVGGERFRCDTVGACIKPGTLVDCRMST